MTNAAVFGPVILLARAVSADHAVGVLVGVIGRLVVAFVAGKNFQAAAETEPAVAFGVVGTAAAAREFLARDDAEGFFWLWGDWLSVNEGFQQGFGNPGTFFRRGARSTRAAELTRRNLTSGILKPECVLLVKPDFGQCQPKTTHSFYGDILCKLPWKILLAQILLLGKGV